MKSSIKILALGSVSVLLIAGSALANPKADLDQDGRVSKVEFVSEANQRFIKTDTNSDGMITEAEREVAKSTRQTERQSEQFTRLDANGDGFISQDEFAQAASDRKAKRHERRDLNGDGTVDKADRQAMRRKFKDARKDRRMERSGENLNPDDIAQRRGRKQLSPDANQDGVVTRAEHDAAVEALFTTLDANGDGFLEKGEARRKKDRGGFRNR